MAVAAVPGFMDSNPSRLVRSLVAVALLLFGFPSGRFAHASGPSSDSAAKAQTAATLTRDLVGLAQRYANARPADKDKIRPQVVDLAGRRKNVLSELMTLATTSARVKIQLARRWTSPARNDPSERST